ncbi:MAG: DUF2924 domain-containing protein [Sphingomicrobium sp.]
MSELSRQLAALPTMSPTELRKEWGRVLKSPAPSITPDLLRRGIAYRLQETVHGALTTAAARELDQLARRIARGDTPLPASTIRLKPGSRLLRTWRNKTYVILVGDSGYIYDNRLFASLSVIAREITGTPWSGPRFFGLLSKRAIREHADG